MPVMVSRSRGRRAINEINMVPFIDVMLVLLIIFMVTAPLISPSVIDLPRVGAAAAQPPAVVQVLLGKDETLQIKTNQTDARAVTLKTLAASVKQLQSAAGAAGTVPVVIAADKAVRYEAVVKVMDSLQRAGVQRVGLSVQTTGAAAGPGA